MKFYLKIREKSCGILEWGICDNSDDIKFLWKTLFEILLHFITLLHYFIQYILSAVNT